MSDWYYAENNEQKGPVLEAELKVLLATHKLPANALVWKEGMAAWTPATDVAALTALTSTAPAATAVASATVKSNPESVTPVTISDIVGKPESLEVDPDDAEKNKIFGIVAYLGILCLVPIFAVKNSPFAKYHANQGVVLLVVEIAILISLWIVEGIFNFILPSGILGILNFLLSLTWIGPLILIALGIINAAAGKCVPLPVIGGIKLLKQPAAAK
jgi:uncharacterized membrane protein